ncbi:MAG: SCO family protein [Pseudomonadota bacterium]
MKAFRYTLWAAVFVMGAFLAYSTVNWTLEQRPNASVTPRADIGGPFQGTLADGTPITEASLKGRPHVMFFGFTNCPDVCPTTLYEASQWLKDLGDDANKLDVYFVTVDPKRDTPEVLANYTSAFDPRIKAISGTEEQMAQMRREYRVFAEQTEDGQDDDTYNVNHTATTFLMNEKGEFVRSIAYGEDQRVALQKLRRLIEDAG